jgi:hypothetical protein
MENRIYNNQGDGGDALYRTMIGIIHASIRCPYFVLLCRLPQFGTENHETSEKIPK